MSGVKRGWYPHTAREPVAQRGLARAAKKTAPVDPLSGQKLALAGRVVTMDDAFTVKPNAAVYIDHGAIVAVQDGAQPAPMGFDAVAPVETGGTLFPGLIELHNHLSYNALPLWSPVPKLFQHRGQWPNHPDYRKLISGPMRVVGQYRDTHGKPALLAPLVRYVECKCLLGGVTTSQGIMLSSNAGVQRFYRGIVRNVEQTDDPDLSEALGRIPDVDGKDARIPGQAEEGRQLFPSAPERGSDQIGPGGLGRPPAFPCAGGRARPVGNQRPLCRHPRRRPAARGL